MFVGGNKRKYGPKNWSDILPPSEIKTRGAKLPSFSRQLKVRPSKKDVEELEKLIASKCDPGAKMNWMSLILILLVCNWFVASNQLKLRN